MAKLLPQTEIEDKLRELNGWQSADGRIKKNYKFSDFKDAFRFMSAMADYSEKVNHHPDWFNSYQQVNVELSTHDAGGVTESDLHWAAQAEEIREQLEQ